MAPSRCGLAHLAREARDRERNLLQAEALLPNLIELFKGFSYKEMDQALHYVMKHPLKPVRVMKEEGLIE